MTDSINSELKTVASNYLDLLKTKVTKTSIATAVEENSYYPSLLALSEAFNKFSIPNQAFRISIEDLEKNEIEAPFVAFMKLPNIGSDFVLITSISKDGYVNTHKTKSKIKLSKDEFKKQYNGVIWLAEPNKNSNETNYELKIKLEKKSKLQQYTLYLSIILVVFALFYININFENGIAYSIIFLLKAIGVATSVLLLIYDIDKSNAFVKD